MSGIISSSSASANSGNSSVIHHFEQNFELSGFGSRGEALVQCVKELVDNAIDACRWRHSDQDPPTVRVALRRLPHREGGEKGATLELQVADNGAGLPDVNKALVLFSSTKSGHGLQKGSSAGANAGKYGLGLTLSLLYSQITFGGSMKVTSATAGSSHWSFTKCGIDLQTGQPSIIHKKTGAKPASWSQGCGTDIRVLVPGDEDALDYAKPRLQALFGRMHLSPDRAAGVTLTCEGCLGGMNVAVPRGGRECSPYLLMDNEDLVRAYAAGVSSMIVMLRADSSTFSEQELDVSHDRLRGSQTCCSSMDSDNGGSQQQSIPSRHVRQGLDRDVSICTFDDDVAVFECQGKNGARVTAAIALQRQKAKHGSNVENTHHQPSAVEKSVPLLVHRFANGVPMLDTNTSSACALAAGVSKAGWRGLGLKISPSRVHHTEGNLRFVLSEAPTPLKVKGGEAWSALADIETIHVSLSAHSNTVPYTSLRKDAIAHKEGYVAATASAVREALASLAKRETGGFCSAAEAAREMMQEDLIPLMAYSIASMVEGSGNPSFQKECLAVLGVGSEYVQHERLRDMLQHDLCQNIRETEENRKRARERASARMRDEKGDRRQSGGSPGRR